MTIMLTTTTKTMTTTMVMMKYLTQNVLNCPHTTTRTHKPTSKNNEKFVGGIPTERDNEHACRRFRYLGYRKH